MQLCLGTALFIDPSPRWSHLRVVVPGIYVYINSTANTRFLQVTRIKDKHSVLELD